MQSALNDTAQHSASSSRPIAPIYNNAKYPQWIGAPHAHPVGGQLKRSISAGSAVKVNGLGARRSLMFKHGYGNLTLRAQVYARKPYASYVNDGFYHRLAKRYIPGTKFMELGANFTMVSFVNPRLERALKELFLP